MPYHIGRVGRLYKVFSVTGRPLSKHPLSLEHAKKQKTAANLAYLRKEKMVPPRA
jgi:hypothetical protein